MRVTDGGAGPGVGEVVTCAPICDIEWHLRLESFDEVFELHLAANGACQLGADFTQLIFQLGDLGVENRGTAEGAIADGFRVVEGNGGRGCDGEGGAGERRRHG